MIKRLILAFALLAGIVPAFAQAPSPVPALPDTERRTAYSITATTCACSVNFAVYGDGTDYQNWIEVWLNGVLVNYNDPTFGWTITSPTGPLAIIPRPITDALVTFNNAQTGTVQIVGARRPRRLSQFSENRGVAARDLNQALTDIVAQNRETWDKTNDVTGRAIVAPPGETMSVLPPKANRAGFSLCFDVTGNPTVCGSIGSTTIAPGAGITFTGTNPTTIAANLAAGQGILITGTNPLVISAPPSAFTFTQAGTGAVPYPASTKIAQSFSVKDFNASGSATTTTGSITSGTNVLTLASAIDFVNGQGIRCNHCGATFSLNAPTALTVTPTGTAGSTIYTYTIASLDSNGGVGAAITQVQTSTGNATLSNTNYNALSWTAASGGATAYAIYGRINGNLALLAITSATNFNDYGKPFPMPPDFLPSTPQASSLPDYLVTTITSGAGSTSLVLGANATTTVTSQTVLHDDTAAIGTAYAAAVSLNAGLLFPNGQYNTSSPLSFNTSNMQIYNNGGALINYVSGGSAVILDGGASGAVNLLYNVTFGTRDRPFHIQGAVGSTAVFARSFHHGVIGVWAKNFSQNGMVVNFAVLSKFFIEMSSNTAGQWTTVPSGGALFDIRGAGEQVTDCDIEVIAEGIYGTGVVMGGAINNRIRGTSEGNLQGGGGVFESSATQDNHYIGFDSEANAAYDYSLNGSQAFLDVSRGVSSTSQGGLFIQTGATRNRIKGGEFNNISINAGAGGTDLEFVNYGTTFTNGSTTTTWRRIFNNSAVFLPDRIFQGSTVSTLPACSAAVQGAMMYVTDATSPSYNGSLTGGGAVTVPVLCNGSSWTAH